jgi:hypothetical protein
MEAVNFSESRGCASSDKWSKVDEQVQKGAGSVLFICSRYSGGHCLSSEGALTCTTLIAS